MSLPVPKEILTQHVAVLGKTRSGKSSVMRGLVEHLLDKQLPVCIIDPKGDWWGVKLAADGKRPGYPVVIFGGEHADVPINEHAGAHVAELFATGNRPCLIDLGGWMVAPRTRFWIEFASTLFKHTKGSRWLVVDEIHNFAPKGKVFDADAGKALHWTNRIASEGLGKGVQMLFASQRPQKVHNDTLTSAETLIAMRVLHPSDRGAVSEWIKGCGDSEGSEVLGSLAQMERGEGWVWSPEIGFGPKRVKFPMFSTYDSFRPQTAEDTKKLKGWAEVDLDEVRQKLAVVVEQAKAEDPRELRKQIAELKKQVGNFTPVAPVKIPAKTVEKFVLKDGQLARAEQILAHLDKLADRYSTFEEDLRVTAKEIRDAIAATRAPQPNTHATMTQRVDHRQAPVMSTQGRRVAPAQATSRPASLVSHEGVTKAEQRVLDAVAWWHAANIAEPTRLQVAMVARYTVNGHFNNLVGGLRSKGLVDYPSSGGVLLTAEGHKAANKPDGDLSRDELIARTMTVLRTEPLQRIFSVVVNEGRDLTREELAERSNYTVNGHFNNMVGSLRSLGVIDYPNRGGVRLAEMFESL